MTLDAILTKLQQAYSALAEVINLDILALIANYPHLAYFIIFLGTFVEGETFIIFAGYYAHQGILSLPLLIFWAAVGSFLGDQVWFFLGRRYGHRMLRRYPRWQPGVESALGLAQKYSTWFILSFRFIYGIRNVSSFALGMSGLGWPRFFVLNFIAAVIWAITFAGSGYLFGKASAAVLGGMAKNVGLGLLVLFLVVGWVLLRIQRRQKAAQANGNGGENGGENGDANGDENGDVNGDGRKVVARDDAGQGDVARDGEAARSKANSTKE